MTKWEPYQSIQRMSQNREYIYGFKRFWLVFPRQLKAYENSAMSHVKTWILFGILDIVILRFALSFHGLKSCYKVKCCNFLNSVIRLMIKKSNKASLCKYVVKALSLHYQCEVKRLLILYIGLLPYKYLWKLLYIHFCEKCFHIFKWFNLMYYSHIPYQSMHHSKSITH